MKLVQNAKSGFSLIEIMVAIAIIGIVMAAVIPGYNALKTRQRVKTTRVSLKAIQSQIDTFHEDIGEYPSSLKDLIVAPTDEKLAENWAGPYISSKKNEIPKDSFGNPFQYELTPGAEHPYELYSYGSGGKGSKSGRINVWNL